MTVDQKLVEEWEQKLIELGLGVNTGHDPHVLKYGFSIGQLEDVNERMRPLSAGAHQVAVELHQREMNRQDHESRTKLRKKIREEKARIRKAIWEKSTT